MIFNNKRSIQVVVLFHVVILLLALISCLDLTVLAETNFQLVKDWPDFNVSSLKFYGSAVAIYPRSQLLVVLHRSDSWEEAGHNLISHDTVIVLDRSSGKILSTWGKDQFVKPHGIEITPGGDLFVTDLKLHQVFKFTDISSSKLSALPSWSPLPELILGERFVSGSDEDHFCAPTDVSVISDTEEFFVADGYCNSRVMKFSKSGQFIQEFGAGKSPLDSLLPFKSFNVPHAVAISPPVKVSNNKDRFTDSEQSMVFVADRNNGRIQSFTLNGTFLYEIGSEVFSPGKGNVPMVFSIAIAPRDKGKLQKTETNNGTILYAVTGKVPVGKAKVFQILVGRSNYSVLSKFSIRSSTKSIMPASNTSSNSSVVFETPHDLVVSRDGSEVYIVEATGRLTLWKFKSNRASISNNASVKLVVPSLLIVFYILFKSKF